MIQVENLVFRLAGKTILDHINLILPSQQIIALIGPNGAGKSTLLALMARLYPVQNGRILFDDIDIMRAPARKVAQKVSLLQQSMRFMSRLTLEDLLIFARFPYHQGRPKEGDWEQVEKMLVYFQLQNHRHAFIDELSGGQRQRALVAMVFAQDTDIILLDEPLNNLDMYHARQLMQQLKKSVTDFKKTIIAVLHDINYAAYYADTIIAMKDGNVLHTGKIEEILTRDNVSQLYSLDIEILQYKGKQLHVYF